MCRRPMASIAASADSTLSVAVQVTPSEGAFSLDQELAVPEDWSMLVEKATQLPDQPPALTRQQMIAPSSSSSTGRGTPLPSRFGAK